MEDKQVLHDEQLDDVTGGTRTALNGKDLIRSLYDVGSNIEKMEEEEIVKMEKAVSDLFRKK